MDKKPRVRRQQYVTNDDYDRVSHIIYNNLQKELWEEEHIKGPKFNKENAEKLTIEGEEYIKSPMVGYEHVILTSYARAINTYRVTILKPSVTSNNFIWYMGGTNINSKEVFEKQGWDHDIPRLIDIYRVNKWKCSIKSKEMKQFFKP